MSNSYKVQLKPSAAKELAKLQRNDQRRIQAVILALSDNPRPPGATQLVNSNGLLRVRSGDFRLIYSVDDQVVTVLVLKIGHRHDVYR